MTSDDVLVAMLDRAADRLGAYAYALTGSQHAGEELVQSALVKVIARRTRLTAPEQAEAYVRRTMRTLHIDQVRRETTWRRLLPRVARRAEEADPAQGVADRDAVLDALATLSQQRRTAVVLRYYEDLTYAEIADAMGVGVGTVKRYVADAVAALGGQFDMTQHDEPAPVREEGLS